jgi:hypothetical protein
MLLLLLLLQGADHLALSGSFLSRGWILPTCSSRHLFSLGIAQTQGAALNWPKSWSRNPTNFGCSGNFRAIPPVATASKGWFPWRVIPTPNGLRVQIKCKRGSAGGSCSAVVRLLVVSSINVFERKSREMEDRENYNADMRSWNDTDGWLGVS